LTQATDHEPSPPQQLPRHDRRFSEFREFSEIRESGGVAGREPEKFLRGRAAIVAGAWPF
jgi:hypothetical protein